MGNHFGRIIQIEETRAAEEAQSKEVEGLDYTLNDQTTRRLILGVLSFGPKAINKLAEWATLPPEMVRTIINDRRFIATLRMVKADPNLILPTQAELYALLIKEATNPNIRSTERQRAIQTLMDQKPDERTENIIGKFRAANPASMGRAREAGGSA